MSGRLAEQGRGDAGELERAQAVDDLLRRAYHGPPDEPLADAAGTARSRRKLPARDRRVAARTRATTPSSLAGTSGQPADSGTGGPALAGDAEATPPAPEHDDAPAAKVIPLGIFNAHEEAKKRW